jgi:hypothetical protein
MMIELKLKHLRNVSDMRGNCLSRAVYRVFILWCEYPTRLFSFRVYKGNEEDGYKKDDVMTGKYIGIQTQ